MSYGRRQPAHSKYGTALTIAADQIKIVDLSFQLQPDCTYVHNRNAAARERKGQIANFRSTAYAELEAGEDASKRDNQAIEHLLRQHVPFGSSWMCKTEQHARRVPCSHVRNPSEKIRPWEMG